MITHLGVENFQSHKGKTGLDFGPGVNIICGLSHSGKTALLRALTLVILNRPKSDGWINWDATDASALLIMERQGETMSFLRSRGKKYGNCYDVDAACFKTADEGHFDGFGLDVPDDVKKLLNMSEENIQKQLSPYYLVCDTPGHIAQHIRTAARLDEIDRTASVLKLKIQGANNKLKTCDSELSCVNTLLGTFEGVDLDQLDKAIETLEDLNETWYDVGKEVNDLSSVVDRLKAIEEIDGEAIDKAVEELAIAKELLSEYTNLSDDVSKLKRILAGVEEVDGEAIDKVVKEVVTAKELVAEYTKLSGEVDDLEHSINVAKSADKDIAEVSRLLSVASVERDDVLKQLVDCPNCGTPLTVKSKKCLLEHSC